MKSRSRRLSVVEGLEGRRLMHAQVSSPIGDVTLGPAQPTTNVDLASHFFTTDTFAGTVVRFTSNLGYFDVQLSDQATPVTVQNFLRYMNAGRYDGTIIHRSLPGFVVQGGGFGTDLNHIPTFEQILNEFSPARPNVRGTIAMAKVGPAEGQQPTPQTINSATSEWFINLADNRNNLDNQNGGFTTFGTVIGNGMAVVDAIAGVPTYQGSGAFGNIPLVNFNGGTPQENNFVRISDVGVAPAITYSATSDDATFATVSVNGGTLTLTTPSATRVGLAHITVTATTLDGGTTGTVFVVRRPDAVAPTITPVPATGGPAVVVSANKAEASFQVRYDDNDKVKAATFGADDVTVTGPNGFSQNATLVSTTLADAASLTVTYKINAPGGTFTAADNGSYSIRVNAGSVTDATGNAVTGAELGSFPISVSAPGGQPDLAGSVNVPSAPVTPTSKNTAGVVITNEGNARAKGTATVVLYASTDGTLANAVTLGTSRVKVDVGPGLSRTYNVAFKAPAAAAEGNYRLLAAVDSTNKIKESDDANNLLVSGGTVEIRPPFVDLAAAFVGAIPGTVTQGAKKGPTVSVRVTNNGNVAAKGGATVRLYASGDQAADDGDVLLVTLPKKVSINPGKSSVVKVKLAPRAGTVAAGTPPQFLRASVAFNGRPAEAEADRDDNDVFSTSTVTFA